MPERRFRDMRLTENEARLRANRHWWNVVYELGKGFNQKVGHAKFIDRAVRLLPLWREWSIERERLWFALIGLGLDIEGDTRDMPRAEMRRRIENESKRSLQALFVLQEVDR